jgi:hypothetical protein
MDTDFVQAIRRVEDFGCRTSVIGICSDVPERLIESIGGWMIQSTMHAYEVRRRKDKRGVDLISDVLAFGRLRYGGAGCDQLRKVFSR